MRVMAIYYSTLELSKYDLTEEKQSNTSTSHSFSGLTLYKLKSNPFAYINSIICNMALLLHYEVFLAFGVSHWLFNCI